MPIQWNLHIEESLQKYDNWHSVSGTVVCVIRNWSTEDAKFFAWIFNGYSTNILTYDCKYIYNVTFYFVRLEKQQFAMYV